MTDGAVPGPVGWVRPASVAGAALGLVAAGVAVERVTVHRALRRRARIALDSSGPYGQLRGTPGSATAEDGTGLYFETDDPADFREADAERGDAGVVPAVAPGAEPAHASGPEPAPPYARLLRRLRRRRSASGGTPVPTVVFSHGYCLGQDIWHFQRAALRGAVRAVYWDQRSHGRSARSPVGEAVSIDLLGRDLKAVLDAAVPEGPIVLVGHSMGGMTMMALADQYPDFVAERVVGVAFLGTSAGGLGEVTYGFPAAGVRAARRVVPGVLKALVAQSELVERARWATADLFAGLVKRYSFGSPGQIDPAVSRFAEQLIESVPVDVVAEFYPAFAEHEKTAALAAFDGRPALVLSGERDLLTPHTHSEAIAAALPAADLVVLEGVGHLLMLERPSRVNDLLAELLTRAVTRRGTSTIRTHGSTAPTDPPAARVEPAGPAGRAGAFGPAGPAGPGRRRGRARRRDPGGDA